jgi:hypothetical protein
MNRQWKEVKTQKLTPDEVEKLLASDFGGKIQPVDSAKLAKQQRMRARYRGSQ